MNDLPMVRLFDLGADLGLLRGLVEAAQGPAQVGWIERQLRHPRGQPAYTLVAEQSGALVGYGALRHERLRLGLATIEVGLIDSIYAAPGAAAEETWQALFGGCLEALATGGLPLAALHGPMKRYGALGFAPYRYQAEVQLNSQAAGSDGEQLREVRPDDLGDLAALYSANYGPLPLTTERTLPDWRWWLEAAPTALLLEDRRGRVAAYAQQVGKDMVVAEAAAADGVAAQALLGALASQAQQGGRDQLVLALAPGHRLCQAALHAGAGLRVTAMPPQGSGPLAGVVDLAALLLALAPELERRLAYSRYNGWSGTLQLDLGDEGAALVVNNGRIAVASGPRPSGVRVRAITLAGAAQLLLGYRGPSALHAAGALHMAESDQGLLDALFPIIWPFC